MTRTFAALALAAATCAACTPTPDAETCTPRRLATLPTLPADGFLAVPVGIAGTQAAMLLDTGAQASLIAKSQVRKLGLPEDPHRTTTVYGTGGGTVQVRDVRLRTLTLGTQETGAISLAAADLPQRLTDLDPPISGIIGLDMLHPYELDIDRPDRRVGLSIRPGCDDAAPDWSFPYARIPLETATDGLLLVPLTVDGARLLAIVDTGARRSVISRSAVARLHLDPAVLARDPTETTNGLDPRTGLGHLHRFQTVRIGPVDWPSPTIDVGGADLPVGEMLLGEDFFRSHRLWLSPNYAAAFLPTTP